MAINTVLMKRSQMTRTLSAEADPIMEGNQTGRYRMANPTIANPSALLEFMPPMMREACHEAQEQSNHLLHNYFHRSQKMFR